MGNGASKEEQLYHAVQNGNTNAVKALRLDGASLEFFDKEGRTPLMFACTRGDLFEMVLTLLNLGANIKAYQPGSHGGQPLHLAAKLGLERTVFLLLSRGADPLAVNDDVLTPLDLARHHGHIAVVRMIEERVALFSGMLRELSGLGFLEAFAPQWVTKKIWAVVVPVDSDPRRPVKCELVIYNSQKNSLPRTLIPLVRAEVEEPKFNLPDPMLILTDKNTRTKYKFLAEAPGDKSQIERLYRACKGGSDQAPAGLPPPTVQQGVIRPAAQQPQMPPAPSAAFSGPSSGKLKNPSEGVLRDEALRMGMDASLRTAAEEGGGYPKVETSKLGGWGDDDRASSSDFNGWGSTSAAAGEAGPSSSSVPAGPGPSGKAPETEHEKVPDVHEKTPITAAEIVSNASSSSLPFAPPTPPSPLPSTPPSAPPIPLDQDGGPIFYPSIDTSPVVIDDTLPAPSSVPAPNAAAAAATEERGGQCVVCWDAKAEAVCIPCGHLAGCMDCLSEIKSKDWGCPVCRTPIQQVIKVYAV